MDGKEGLAATRVRKLMLRLVERLEAEVARFEAEPPEAPAERIKFIADAARAGRAIVLAEAGAVRAERLVEAVKLKPNGAGEDEDGDGMRDCDISDEQFEALKAGLEQKLLAEARLEQKGGPGPIGARPVEPADDAGLGGRSPDRAAG
jgi:hypothetical protein